MISRLLCLGNYLLEYTALYVHEADVFLESLHWTCPSCKNINIDFYKFVKSYKGEFETIEGILCLAILSSEFWSLI